MNIEINLINTIALVLQEINQLILQLVEIIQIIMDEDDDYDEVLPITLISSARSIWMFVRCWCIFIFIRMLINSFEASIWCFLGKGYTGKYCRVF